MEGGVDTIGACRDAGRKTAVLVRLQAHGPRGVLKLHIGRVGVVERVSASHWVDPTRHSIRIHPIAGVDMMGVH